MLGVQIMNPSMTILSKQMRYYTAQWILPVSSEPIEWGFIAIQGSRIQAVGRYGDLPETHRIPPPQAGTLITPGLINTHVHLEQSFPEPISKAPTDSFVDWLLGVIRTCAHNQPLSLFNRCLQGAQEVLRTGTTFVNDIASGPESVEALQKTGLRGIVSLEVFHPGFSPIQIDHWIHAYQALQAAAGEAHPLLQVSLSPHSLYNVSPQAWHALQDLLQPPLIHTHVAEFEAEMDYLAAQPSDIDKLHQQVLGKTFRPAAPMGSPIQTLMRNHLLENPTLMAHAIHLTASDRLALASLPVGIAHCPRSNLALHGQTLHWPDWQDSNIPMGLGTDGRLSTPSLDLREEARCAIRQHGWTNREALEAMTLGGAKALQMAPEIGSLEAGKRADLVLWQTGGSQAVQSPEAMLFHVETNVLEVVIDGQIQAPGEPA
jgi:5-methylthioadenosine/S-adenosylhomocysteine deaminase